MGFDSLQLLAVAQHHLVQRPGVPVQNIHSEEFHNVEVWQWLEEHYTFKIDRSYIALIWFTNKVEKRLYKMNISSLKES